MRNGCGTNAQKRHQDAASPRDTEARRHGCRGQESERATARASGAGGLEDSACWGIALTETCGSGSTQGVWFITGCSTGFGEALAREHPPMGEIAVNSIRAELAAVERELKEWEEAACATSFPT